MRPLRQMTGEAEFNEVYFTDVRIPDAERLGDVGDGWHVALTTLMNERVSIGGGIAPRGSGPIAEAVRLWDDSARRRRSRDRTTRSSRTALVQLLGRAEVPTGSPTSAPRRTASRARPGRRDRPASSRWPSSTSDLRPVHRPDRAEGMLYPLATRWSAPSWPGGANNPDIRKSFLRARANSIEGGTSEVMRNILGERVLGLPGESASTRTCPGARSRANVTAAGVPRVPRPARRAHRRRGAVAGVRRRATPSTSPARATSTSCLAGQRRSRRPGDSDEMVDARRRFLATGAYDPLTAAVARAVVAAAPAELVLDVGCGEGRHARGLAAARPRRSVRRRRRVEAGRRPRRAGPIPTAGTRSPAPVDLPVGRPAGRRRRRRVRTGGRRRAGPRRSPRRHRRRRPSRPRPSRSPSLPGVRRRPSPHQVKAPLRDAPEWFETTGRRRRHVHYRGLGQR